MRNRLVLLLLLFSLAHVAVAAKRTTVAQLRNILSGAHANHRSDEAVAQDLAGIEVSARINRSVLAELLAESPGPKTSLKIKVLADESAFLEPPAEDIPSRPAPDLATQKVLLGQAVHYVARTLPTLPDFLATRRTERYDDAPSSSAPGDSVSRNGFNFKGVSESSIAFRDGRETDDPSAIAASLTTSRKEAHPAKGKVKPSPAEAVPSKSLVSWGEFGPILGLVLVDAAKGKLGWDHWEMLDGKAAAVFQFSVDRAISHYTVQYMHGGKGEVVGSSYGANATLRKNANGPSAGMVRQDGDVTLVRQATGYHGYLTVDPETGTILRISIEADLHPDDPILRAGILVEYGPVKIGEATYTCPIHSVSVSASNEMYQRGPSSASFSITKTQLNNDDFVAYRRFGSEATLVHDPPAAEQQTGSADAEVAMAETATAAPESEAAHEPTGTPSASESVPAEAAVAATANAPAPVVSPASAPLTAAEREADEEILVRAVNGLPGAGEPAFNNAAGATGSTEAGAFTLKVTTRLVDIGLIALDKHGKPVLDLKQEDIEIYDNGRRQQVRGFHHAAPSAVVAAQPAETAPEQETFTNGVTTVREVQEAPDMLILLLDESHLAFQDLNRARGEVLRFLKATRPTSRVALYSIGERGFHIIQDVTQDHELVAKKLAAWMPDASAVAQAQTLERRNKQQFDTVRSVQDLNFVNGNSIDAPDTMQTTDPELMQMGANPLRASLEGMMALARHFAPVAGHKSLAWIAGDSVLSDWESQAVGTDKGQKYLDAAMMHARESLNEAHIALYVVDASALEAGGVDASLQNRNVQLSQAAQDTASLNGGTSPRDATAGRMTAQMQQDLHGIQGPVRQLAEATGGRAIRRGGDLKATLDSIEDDSASLYEISFGPDSQADGKFHTLLVKIPSRKDVRLRYRTSYLYDEEQSASTRQRFEQAVWSPQDLTGLQLTAEALPPDSAGKSMVKVRVAFPGLALEQKDGRWKDQLYIFTVLRDDATSKAQVAGDTLKISLKQATYETGMPTGIPYQHPVEANAKLGSVRIIVVDANSGRMGSVTLPSTAFKP